MLRSFYEFILISAGRILNMSCVNLPYGRNVWDAAVFNIAERACDPDTSMWTVQSNKNILYLQFLRIFYVVGAPQPVEIGEFEYI